MGFPKGVKRDFAALEKRCIEAVRLVVEKGLSQAEAARRVQAAQQSVSGWVQRYREDGRAGLAVECQQVVHRKHESGEGRTVAESGVRAMPVVVVQPG